MSPFYNNSLVHLEFHQYANCLTKHYVQTVYLYMKIVIDLVTSVLIYVSKKNPHSLHPQEIFKVYNLK